MADADLLSIGRHCEACGSLDFLPFRCDACKQVFCLNHRSYKAHACTEAAGRESSIIKCPLCAKAVKVLPGEDPSAVFKAHTSQVQENEGPCEGSGFTTSACQVLKRSGEEMRLKLILCAGLSSHQFWRGAQEAQVPCFRV